MSVPVRSERATPLSRDRILDEASALLRDDGARAFSMRRLAARLNVTPMALYKWFDNRDALLRALTERALEVGDAAAGDPGASWPDRVVAVARTLRTELVENRQLLQLVGAPRPLGGAMAVTTDRLLGLVREIGFDGVEAVEAYRVLFWTAVSHCLVVDADGAMPALAPDYDGDRAVQQSIESAGVDLPNVSTLRSSFRRVEPDAFFETVVRTVAAGLEARAPH